MKYTSSGMFTMVVLEASYNLAGMLCSRVVKAADGTCVECLLTFLGTSPKDQIM